MNMEETFMKKENCILTNGYSDEGIYYKVETISNVLLANDSIFITRKITYDGQISPSLQLSWHEAINGVTYSGTLYLTNFSYNPSTNQTIATYQGTLTAD